MPIMLVTQTPVPPPAAPDTVELYKKYRPQRLSEVVGNKKAVAQLKGYGRERLPHSILFIGPSGNGKTTLARICARGLGAVGPDLREINSASFKGIDTVRELGATQGLAPMGSRCKVLIVDEVHQITAQAQDALLKYLEDTPAHVYYMLATTDPSKLKPAIRTRCTEIQVELLTDTEAETLATRVMAAEGFTLDPVIVDKLVEAAAGSARKLLVIMDQVRGVPDLKDQAAVIEKATGGSVAFDLARAVAAGKPWTTVAKLLKSCEDEPEGIRRVCAAYLTTVALGANDASAPTVLRQLSCFTEDWYASGNLKAAAAVACYKAIQIKHQAQG